MCPWSISDAEAHLDAGLFLRVHRSHVVALLYVTFVRKEEAARSWMAHCRIGFRSAQDR